MRRWEGSWAAYEGDNNGGEGATQASLPGVVGAVLRVDVEFFTLQNTGTNVLMCQPDDRWIYAS